MTGLLHQRYLCLRNRQKSHFTSILHTPSNSNTGFTNKPQETPTMLDHYYNEISLYVIAMTVHHVVCVHTY